MRLTPFILCGILLVFCSYTRFREPSITWIHDKCIKLRFAMFLKKTKYINVIFRKCNFQNISIKSFGNVYIIVLIIQCTLDLLKSFCPCVLTSDPPADPSDESLRSYLRKHPLLPSSPSSPVIFSIKQCFLILHSPSVRISK